MRVLLIGLNVDGNALGESLSAFKLARAYSEQVDTTLLCLQPDWRPSIAAQLPRANVITFPQPQFLRRWPRFTAIVKPTWPVFCYHVDKWIRDASARGEHFDFAHQLVPQQMRSPSPFRHHTIPYAIGPVGGSLDTPRAFRTEIMKPSVWERLRSLDRVRFNYDPRLRHSFAKAELVLGVAPYVRDVLRSIPLKRFESMLEFSREPLASTEPKHSVPGLLRLLHVGRGIRTKGLRDVVRALALLPDLPGVTLTSAGTGPEIEICRAEASRLGVAERITFLGQVPRERVEELYATHHVFAFPSFREPMGGVYFEAMRWQMPIIGTSIGGPDAILDDSCGFRLQVDSPSQLANNIASAVRDLASDPDRLRELSVGAGQRMTSFPTWEEKATSLIATFREILRSPDDS